MKIESNEPLALVAVPSEEPNQDAPQTPPLVDADGTVIVVEPELAQEIAERIEDNPNAQIVIDGNQIVAVTTSDTMDPEALAALEGAKVVSYGWFYGQWRTFYVKVAHWFPGLRNPIWLRLVNSDRIIDSADQVALAQARRGTKFREEHAAQLRHSERMSAERVHETTVETKAPKRVMLGK